MKNKRVINYITEFGWCDAVKNIWGLHKKDCQPCIEKTVCGRYILLTEFAGLKSCNHCGISFIPETRKDTMYCKECRKPANSNARYLMKRNSVAWQMYRRGCKTKNAQKRRGFQCKENEEKYTRWVLKAKLQGDNCDKGLITKEQFEQWIKEPIDWKKT